MVEFHIDDSSFKRYMKNMAVKFPKETRSAVKDATKAVWQSAMEEVPIGKDAPVSKAWKKQFGRTKKTGHGNLRRSISGTISDGGMTGTVKPTVQYGLYVHEGTRAHIIRPRNSKALFWNGANHPVKVVNHPGTKANPFLKRAFDKNQSKIRTIFENHLSSALKN